MGTHGFITITVAVLLSFAVPSCQGSGGAIDGIDLPNGQDGATMDLSEVANDQASTDLNCIPECNDKTCGDNGCGGSCGTCAEGSWCSGGICEQPYVVADTGQVKCYNEDSEITCPQLGKPFYGQDGNYVGNPLSFKDNGDGSVTDMLTGLVWAKCPGGQKGPSCSGKALDVDWQQAVDHCEQNKASLAGSGWRLSTRTELLSIMDFGQCSAVGVLDPEYFGGTPGVTWTATDFGPEKAYAIQMANGSAGAGWHKVDQTGYFRCVRGKELVYDKLEDPADGTVVDHSTQLIWQKEIDWQKRTWGEALQYCEELVLAGSDDWLLPDVRQISTLMDYTSPNQVLNEAFFPDAVPLSGQQYWTGTTMPCSIYTHAGYAPYTDGTMGYNTNPKTMEALVRCVRRECQPDCVGKECGDDGCGGSCGPCSNQLTCQWGACIDKTASTYELIPAGEFSMGSPDGTGGTPAENCRSPQEIQHKVQLSRPFWMKATEVTIGEWVAITGSANPSSFQDCGPDCPANAMTWYQAIDYCNALSSLEGLVPCYTVSADGDVGWPLGYACPGYRLPTEAEWEYASRAGTTTALYNGPLEHCLCEYDAMLASIAWYAGNFQEVSYEGCMDLSENICPGPVCGGPQPVAGKTPNKWGLFDVSGGVWEWCWDWWGPYGGDTIDPIGPPSGETKVLRGGSWGDYAKYARSAYRLGLYAPDHSDNPMGFRPVRTVCEFECEDVDCGVGFCGGECTPCP